MSKRSVYVVGVVIGLTLVLACGNVDGGSCTTVGAQHHENGKTYECKKKANDNAPKWYRIK